MPRQPDPPARWEGTGSSWGRSGSTRPASRSSVCTTPARWCSTRSSIRSRLVSSVSPLVASISRQRRSGEAGLMVSQRGSGRAARARLNVGKSRWGSACAAAHSPANDAESSIPAHKSKTSRSNGERRNVTHRVSIAGFPSTPSSHSGSLIGSPSSSSPSARSSAAWRSSNWRTRSRDDAR